MAIETDSQEPYAPDPSVLGDQGMRIAAIREKKRPGLISLMASDLQMHIYQVRWRALRSYPTWQRPLVVLGVLFRLDTLWAVWGYRLKRFFVRSHIPLLPQVIDLVVGIGYQVQIGDHVYIGPGLYIPHGHVVMDGFVELGRNCTISPFVTFGLRNSRGGGFSFLGPRCGDGLWVGTHSALLGDIVLGNHVSVGAHSLVLADLPDYCTAAGVPAKLLRRFSAEDKELLSKIRQYGYQAD
jgi:serine O-acetyltransferase